VFEPVPYTEYDQARRGHFLVAPGTVAMAWARTIKLFDALWRPRLTRAFEIAKKGATAKGTVLSSLRQRQPHELRVRTRGRAHFSSVPNRQAWPGAVGPRFYENPGAASAPPYGRQAELGTT